MALKSQGKPTWIATLCMLLMASTALAAGPASRPSTQPADDADMDIQMVGKPKAATGDLSDMSLEDLMNVEVTSVSKKKQSIADAPAAITVISQDDISRSGFSTIPDLLRLVPGMDVGRINGSQWAVGARGLNGEFANTLLVLQDGRSVYTPLYGGVLWDTVDYTLEDLDRIEVIRGPGATLWGANAVNGVINITSKDARDTQGWLVSTRGSNLDSDLSARYGGKLSDDTFYRVYVKGKYDAELDSAAGNASDDWYSGRGGFRIDKHPSDQDTFTLQGDGAENRERFPSLEPVYTPPFEQQSVPVRTVITGNLLARWTHRTDDNSDFSLQMYYDYFGVHGAFNGYDQNTVDFDFHDRFTLATWNEISWGLGYRVFNIATGAFPNEYLVPPSQTKNLYSGFVQDTITLRPHQWFVTVGSKLEHNDFTGFEAEPSARLLWTPDEHNSVWGAVSRAVVTPSVVDRGIRYVESRFQEPTGTGATIPAEVLVNGNPAFQSEKLIAYELGYRLKPAKTISLDFAAFYNSYSSLESVQALAPQPGVPVIIPVQLQNGIAGDTYGGEVGGTFQVTDRWRLSASYSLLEAVFYPRTGSSDMVTPGQYRGSAPEHQAQIRSYLDITRNVQFNASVYYTGQVSEFGIPAYVSTDFNIAWHPKQEMEVKVGVTNLFDNKHPEYGDSFGEGVASEVPRTFYVQVSYAF